MIQIGRIVPNGKIHMHLDGKGCGAARRRRIAQPIAYDMLMWAAPADLCKRCFTARRLELASQAHAYGLAARWDAALDDFLTRVPAARALQEERTPAARLEEIRREIAARFQSEGIMV